MTAETPLNSPPPRSFSLSIGQLTFGSFMLVLAVIIITSTASVIAIRHIDSTFAELQRLQSVGDLAEDIDRRMNELRLAARDFVTDPGSQSLQVGEAATTLSEVLKKTRLELAPEQQDMIDGVSERLSTYRSGIERISSLINRRAEMIVALPPLREKFDAAIAEAIEQERRRRQIGTIRQTSATKCHLICVKQLGFICIRRFEAREIRAKELAGREVF
jgi:CHASE3 domain sensor protein